MTDGLTEKCNILSGHRRLGVRKMYPLAGDRNLGTWGLIFRR